MSKALRFNLFQPVAHFRDPKVLQDDFIATLNLPAPTTIAGMLSYLCDCKFEEDLEVAVIGTYEKKEVHFSRGERADFWRGYQKYAKKKTNDEQKKGENYMYYKQKLATNRLMYYEVLRNLELTIFVKASDSLLEKIKENLKHQKRYLSLGRKEDTALMVTSNGTNYKKAIPEIVDIHEITLGAVTDALSRKIKLSHSYLRIDHMPQEKVLASGTLYTLPYTYQRLSTDKADSQKVYRQYSYVEEGFYPEHCQIFCYKKNNEESEYFLWM